MNNYNNLNHIRLWEFQKFTINLKDKVERSQFVPNYIIFWAYIVHIHRIIFEKL